MNIEKYTQNAQGAIIDCQNIAVEEGHQQIDGEHLHLALLMQKDGLIPKLLKFMNINMGEVIGAIQQQIDKLPKVSGSAEIHVSPQEDCPAPFECGEKSRENEGRVCQCGASLSGIAGQKRGHRLQKFSNDTALRKINSWRH